MREITVSTRGADDREELHERFASAFGFPSYYGRNLAALFDCLTDVTTPTFLTFHLDGDISEDLHTYAERMVQVLVDAEMVNPALSISIRRD